MIVQTQNATVEGRACSTCWYFVTFLALNGEPQNHCELPRASHDYVIDGNPDEQVCSRWTTTQ